MKNYKPIKDRDMKKYENSRTGGPMIKDERKFLSNDRKVLKFWVQSTEDVMVMNYYLSDDTVEIKEQQMPKSGRDALCNKLINNIII